MSNATWFSRLSMWVSRVSGRPSAFISVATLVLVWAVSGVLFHFSDTWQLVMNTISSIVTFLMVFVIQDTQNRQTDALQIKLDELIRATSGARNEMLDLEELEAEELGRLRDHYLGLAQRAREALERGERLPKIGPAAARDNAAP
jgi:low affinity Fe/Cu permease